MSTKNPIGPLGVSPASGYGYVVGTSARFFGEGSINPKFYSWNSFFQIMPSSFSGETLDKIKVGPSGSFLYGYSGSIESLEQEISIPGDPTYVYIECSVADAEITNAGIKVYGTRQPLFEPEDDLAKQTKARHFLGMVKRNRPWYKFGKNLSYPVIQSSFSVPIAIPSCINGFRGVLITTA